MEVDTKGVLCELEPKPPSQIEILCNVNESF